jgi:hypothetical protein
MQARDVKGDIVYALSQQSMISYFVCATFLYEVMHMNRKVIYKKSILSFRNHVLNAMIEIAFIARSEYK